MTTSAQLQSIATSLDTYRTQFAALGNALSALRFVSDQLIAQLDRDREALETHLQAAIAIEAAAHTEAEATVPALSLVEQTTAAEEVQSAAELHDERGDTSLAEEAEHTTETDAITSPEQEAVSIDETAPSEAATQPSLDASVTIHTGSEIDASAVDAAVPAADAALTTAIATPPDTAIDATTASAAVASDDKVISLADRRKAKPAISPTRRRTKAFVASILVAVGATFGLHELLQSDLGQRVLELGTCDGDMLSATRDCSLLAWFTI